MRLGLIVLGLIAVTASGSASAQEMTTFLPRVKAGDVFEARSQQTTRFAPEGSAIPSVPRGSATVAIEATVTIVEAEDGRPSRLDEAITRYAESNAGVALPAQGQKDPLEGVTFRYDRVGETFKPSLLQGDHNVAVAKWLQQDEDAPLNENFLPTKPLSVGQSQPIANPARLGGAKLGDEGVEYVKEPRITFQRVETIDGVKTAILVSEFDLRFPHGEAGLEDTPATMHYEATARYDLDRQYVTRVEANVKIQTPAEIQGERTTMVIETTTVDHFHKK